LDDLAQSIAWMAPLLLGVLTWMGSQLRESRWGREVAQRISLKQREQLLQLEPDAATWELAPVYLGAIS